MKTPIELTRRKDGRWCKKHCGKMYYFKGTEAEANVQWKAKLAELTTEASKQVAKGRHVDQKVKSRTPAKSIKLALSLVRTTFSTSREMDFFSKKELITQTGHEVAEWPLVFLKEVIDNALDACEEADVPPVVDVVADAAGITIRDNGNGLPESTLKAAMDFTVRASSREVYVSPCRGAQGNALKTLLPMPRVVDPDSGRLIVQAHGKRHIITCGANPISQQAEVNDDAADVPTIGTEIRMEWEANGSLDDGGPWPFGDTADEHHADIRAMVEGFAVFNPHATFYLDWFGKRVTWTATNPTWDKWKPNKPTSPHWYEQRHFERLIGAYITHDRSRGEDRLVSDFLAEFDGLTGSHNRTKVLDDAELKRVKLSELVVADKFDSERIAKLLAAMQKHTRPVTSKRLGIIGADHLKASLLQMGIKPESFRYSRKVAKEGLPWVLESAFGWLGDDESWRRIYSGANWSAAIKNPFRSFGNTGEGLETALSEMRATRNEPVVFVLHLAHPRVEYTDRGKSALIVGGAS